MGIHRSARQRARRQAAADCKVENRPRKIKERDRRDARILERIRQTTPPYAPEVMSWLSVRLQKQASKITPQDIAALAAPAH